MDGLGRADGSGVAIALVAHHDAFRIEHLDGRTGGGHPAMEGEHSVEVCGQYRHAAAADGRAEHRTLTDPHLIDHFRDQLDQNGMMASRAEHTGERR